jgi:ABC-type cobalamin/Fe3+-siderophores transport system ATPase subunit
MPTSVGQSQLGDLGSHVNQLAKYDLGRHVNQLAKYGRYYYLTIYNPRPNDKQQIHNLLEIKGMGH